MRVGDRDDRGGLPDCDDGAGVRHGPNPGGRPCDTPPSNTRGPDHTTRRSRRGGCSADRFSGEAACPRRRRGSTLRLDTALKPWHKETTGSVRRSIEAVTEGLEGSAPGPHLIRRSAQLTRLARDHSIRRGYGRCRSRGRTERAHRCLEISLENARFPQRPQPFPFLQKNKDEKQLRRRWSRFTRFQVSADTSVLDDLRGVPAHAPPRDRSAFWPFRA
jgi:hypothetical protein